MSRDAAAIGGYTVKDSQGLIAICDDNRSVARLVAEQLKRKGFSSEVFTETCSLIRTAQDGRFAAIIIDYLMPELDGVAAIRELRERGIETPVIVTSGVFDADAAEAAAEAGAMRWQVKPLTDNDLEDVLHEVGLEAALRRKADADRVVRSDRVALDELMTRVSRLTPRELEVLKSLCDGSPNKLVAHALGISIKTVELHRARVMQKMEASSFAQLVRLAIRAGLVQEAGAEPLVEQLRDLASENLWLKSKLVGGNQTA